MIRIDSDSHFTPLDASDEVDPKYADMGAHFLRLPTGRYRVAEAVPVNLTIKEFISMWTLMII